METRIQPERTAGRRLQVVPARLPGLEEYRGYSKRSTTDGVLEPTLLRDCTSGLQAKAPLIADNPAFEMQ